MMTDLNCQIDWLWNKQKSNPAGAPLRDFLGQIILRGNIHPKYVWYLLVAAQIKEYGCRKLCLCLLALALTGKFIYQHSFADIRTSFLRHPTQTVAPASSNSSGLQYQIGPVKTSTSWTEQLSDSQPLWSEIIIIGLQYYIPESNKFPVCVSYISVPLEDPE